MRVKFTVVRSDFRELEQNLARLEKRATRRSVARRALMAAAEPIEASAREFAPDDPATGAPYDLKSSITSSTRQKSKRRAFRKINDSDQVVHIGPTREGYPQAMVMEFGGKFHRAIGFMRRAWRAEGGEKALDRIAKVMTEEIARAIKLQDRRQARARRKAGR